jgi:hypothetical protein
MTNENCILNDKRYLKRGGVSSGKVYRSWYNMILRCYNENHHAYKNYGGRGIIICDEWLEEKDGFIKFYTWATINGYEEGLTIDRIDVDGNYEPSNCRWITLEEQVKNKHKYNDSKLSKEDILYIKNELDKGVVGAYLARKFNVSRTTISKIKKGKYDDKIK